jgi:peptide/nickel transport system substrate-binding protein
VQKNIFRFVWDYWQRQRQQRRATEKKHDLQLLRRVHGRHFPGLKQVKHLNKLLSPREKKIWRLSFLVLSIGLIWAGLLSLQKYRLQVPASGGSYTEAVVGSPELINPLFASLNDADMDITRLVFAGLMRVDSKQRIVPDLAVDYKLSDDKKTYTFNLRQDAVWHDGEKLTSRDVLFTFETLQNPAVSSPLLVSFQGVKVEAVDDYIVTFTLAEPFPSFLASLTVGILPEHKWYDITPERMRLAQINLEPVGAGPFKFKRMIKDDTGRIYQYELEQFDRYCHQLPYLDQFIFQFFSDYDGEGGAIQALREQVVDSLHFVPNDLRDKAERKHIVLRTLQLPQYTALFFNQERQPYLQESGLRTALADSLDKDRILRESLKGGGQVIYSPILPGFPGYNPEIERTPYSTDKSNELLDKNWTRVNAIDYRTFRREELIKEWKNNNPVSLTTSTTSTVAVTTTTPEIAPEAQQTIEDQLNQEINPAQTFFRKNKKGEYLELNLVTADTKEYQQIAERVAGFWQEIGIKTKIDYVAPRNLSHDILKGRNYDVILYGVIMGSDPDQYPFWHSSQIDYPGANLARYVNRNADALLEQARSSADDKMITEAYKKFQDLILADQPAIFLNMPTYTYAVSDKLKGSEVTRVFAPSDRFADVTNWYIKTKGVWNFGN